MKKADRKFAAEQVEAQIKAAGKTAKVTYSDTGAPKIVIKSTSVEVAIPIDGETLRRGAVIARELL